MQHCWTDSRWLRGNPNIKDIIVNNRVIEIHLAAGTNVMDQIMQLI